MLRGSNGRISLKTVRGGPQRVATLLLTASGLQAFICNIAQLTGTSDLRKLLSASKRCRERLAQGIIEVFKDRLKLPPQMNSKLCRLAEVKNADLVLAALDYIWRRKAWDRKALVAVLSNMLGRSPIRTMWASFALLCARAILEQERCRNGSNVAVQENETYHNWFDRPARQAAVLFFSRSVRTSRLAAVAIVQPLLGHGDECVHRAAVEALEVLNKDPAVQIATWAAHMERMGSFSPATEALRRIAIHSDATRLSAVVAGLEHANPDVRMAAVRALTNPPDIDMLDLHHVTDGLTLASSNRKIASPPAATTAVSEHGSRQARHRKQESDCAEPGTPKTVPEQRCYCLICIQQRLSLVEAVA